jgi:RluA family pseudouridine synthase
MDRIKGMVLWSDETLLAINKPAGMPSLPDGYDPDAPHLRSTLEASYGRLWTVHRLDRHTSGVVLLARTAEAHQNLNTQFQDRKVSKIYHALVEGDPNWSEMTIDLPLRADGDRQHRTVVDPKNGKPASTRMRVLERFGRHALVEAIPETGRTHQVRVHLKEAGAPVACDPLYGGGQSIYLSHLDPIVEEGSTGDCLLLNRLGLHSWSLTVKHPLTLETLLLHAPYPDDLISTLETCRQMREQINGL